MNAKSGLYKSIVVIGLVVLSIGFVVHTEAQQTPYDCTQQTDVSISECEALVALYYSADGANWINKTGWNIQGVGPCSWYGVSCGNSNITNLNLSINGLRGTLPPEIGNLSKLQDLRMSQNQLSGSLPPSIGNLKVLKSLYLFNNQFTGPLPPEIGSLSSLQELHLNVNQFSGAIPPEIGNLALLVNIQLDQNQFTGSLPPEIGSLSNLQQFDLSSNQFSGAIPPEIGNLSKLQTLDLRVNNFSGAIPPEIGNLSKLENLYLNFNRLDGSIPPQLGQLSNLLILQLSSNTLSGPIPPEIGNLNRLLDLSLDQNQLTGSIPSVLGNLPNLRGLRLGTNYLSGDIPATIGNLSNLRVLDVSSNQLNGEVPPSITNLTRLQAAPTRFAYNMLSAADMTVTAFLDGLDPMWQNTQTLPPTALEIMNVTANSVRLAWAPIAYTADGGYYEVGYGTAAGGPYQFAAQNRTPDKSTTEIEIANLQPSTQYYFVVRTVTQANSQNKNTLTSAYSAQITVMTEAPLPTPTATESPTPMPTVTEAPPPTQTPVPTIEITPEQTQTETAPITPDQVQVQFGAVTGETPTFTWASPTAMPTDWYQLVITTAAGETVVDHWFQAHNLCVNGVCTLTPEMLIPFGLANGSYSVQINIWADEDGDGEGVVISVGQTTIEVAGNNLIDVMGGRVKLHFQNNPDVTWVQVWVGRADSLETVGQFNRAGEFAGWYEKTTEMTCDATTCSLVTAVHPSNGNYVMYLRKWTGELSAWGGPFEFSVNLPQPQHPDGLSASIEGNHPLLSWQASPGATWYQVWLGTSAPEVQSLYWHWHSALDLGCDDGTCTLRLAYPDLTAGQSYIWYVQAWGPGGFSRGGIEGWSEGPVITP